VTNAAEIIRSAADPDANIIFGTVIDDALGDEVRITVIAAGFDGGGFSRARTEAPRRAGAAVPAEPQAAPPAEQIDLTEQPGRDSRDDQLARTTPQRTVTFDDLAPERDRPQLPRAARPERRPVVFEDDDLDVPDFLK